MAMDYKSAPGKRGGSGGNDGARRAPMNPMFLGVVIGLLLGIIIALGVALWLNKSAIPFMERTKPLEPPPKLESRVPPKTEPARPAADAAPAKPGDKPRFDFYQILPGDKDGTGAKTPPPRKPETAAPTAPQPANAAPSVPPAAKAAPDKTGGPREIYYLQAGAFQNTGEADNLKAKLAFVGFEATVTQVSVPDKGTLYRVRLGPYQSSEEVNRVKATLSQNGVNAAIVKTTDTVN